ncbi:MAG: hypothetical protein B7Y80_16855 [Hyphomicrobium sp. 32-62-53]|nr:MAG: hypothetical protein B7Z29_07965 [Hyphomicrobium sp. 12-62-95]OYX98045.1 MAG: hypothetical protein B7Y80_16855 [Hyphomicrobium sp. 32-62-53]
MAANFEALDYRDPRKALEEFVLNLREFLNELVKEQHSPAGEPLFWPQLTEDLVAAWSAESERFAPISKQARELKDGTLRDHGLEGAALKLKLGVVDFWHRRYRIVGKTALRRLIEALNDLLKSYLAAIGANEALAEIKDFIRNCLLD